MHNFENWMENYGYLTLFLGLLLEYIALPFPGELVMGYSGEMVYRGRLNLMLALLVAWLGTAIGTSITYFIGRKLGYPFLIKYGPRFFLGPNKLEAARDSFNTYGSKLLFFTFFIPGVRHFTGYLSGVLNIPFRTFALYTYSGSLFWVVTFIVGGRLLGPKWEMINEAASRYGWEIALFAAAVVGICLSYSKVAVRFNDRIFRLRESSGYMQMRLILIGGLSFSISVYRVLIAANS